MKTKNVNRYNVPSDWKVDNLGNVTNNFDSKRVPLSTMERSKKKGPFPYYGAAKIIDYIDDYIFDGEYCLIAEDGSVIKKDKTPFLQLLNGKFWPNNHTHVISAKHPLNNKYLFYYLSGIDISPFITGAAQPKINQKNLNKIPIVIPPKNIMNKIASILSNYDKLKENNTRRIEILKEMAQRIYKEWFVDFKYPGHENDKLVDSELGMIPEGWEVNEFGNSIKFQRGKNLTKKQMVEGDIPVVSAGIKPSGFHNISNVTGPIVTVSASGANAGYISLYLRDVWAADCSYFNHESTDFFFYFYCLINSRKREVNNMQRGAAQPHVYPKDLMSLLVINPPENLIEKFEEISKPIFYQVGNFRKKNIILTQTRDYLLPKLISGKVDVSDLDIDTSILDE
tara:strand:+ start:13362 stop:14549 length:1188 start_codon:yes stop_codon:yes gene_type:complete